MIIEKPCLKVELLEGGLELTPGLQQLLILARALGRQQLALVSDLLQLQPELVALLLARPQPLLRLLPLLLAPPQLAPRALQLLLERLRRARLLLAQLPHLTQLILQLGVLLRLLRHDLQRFLVDQMQVRQTSSLNQKFIFISKTNYLHIYIQCQYLRTFLSNII